MEMESSDASCSSCILDKDILLSNENGLGLSNDRNPVIHVSISQMKG